MRIADVVTVLREDGPRWLAWRMWYEVQLRWGFSRSLPPVVDVGVLLAQALKEPAAEIDDWLYKAWQEESGALSLEGDNARKLPSFVTDEDAAIELAERTLAGDFRYFSSTWRELGYPPDWFRGVQEGSHWRSDLHWSHLPDLSRELGDIKYVWEPSRFGFVYGLARAWVATGDHRYPEAFWRLTEDWLDANSPERGPHWRCAQEMALRSMAWVFGLSLFRDCPSTTPARVARLIKQIWYHGVHIEKVHWYAKECVRNNHTISESVGLFTIGTMLPFLPQAKQWQTFGLKQLEREIAWQVYEDGTYIQHSMNYARLVAQLFTWTIGLAKANRVTLPSMVRDRATRLLHFLVSMQDRQSGRVPNYGSNDGALILPLSSCNYLDYRPTLGALSLALEEGRLYPPGPWDEEATWLVGPESHSQTNPTPTITPVSAAFPHGGYYRLQGESTYATIRCASYSHRPAQADMLHLDLWWQGQNVLVDPGTFSYNLQPPWSGYFVGTASHNTVQVDGKDQMRKGSRFMWLNWTKSRILRFDTRSDTTVFSGEHYGYGPVVHRRTVVLRGDVYVVIDDLRGDGVERTYRLHWLVNDFPVEHDTRGGTIHLSDANQAPLRLAVLSSHGGAANWSRGDEDAPRGWQSLYYGERTPTWSMEWVVKGKDTRFVTIFGPKDRVDGLVPLASESLAGLLANWGVDEGVML